MNLLQRFRKKATDFGVGKVSIRKIDTVFLYEDHFYIRDFKHIRGNFTPDFFGAFADYCLRQNAGSCLVNINRCRYVAEDDIYIIVLETKPSYSQFYIKKK